MTGADAVPCSYGSDNFTHKFSSSFGKSYGKDSVQSNKCVNFNLNLNELDVYVNLPSGGSGTADTLGASAFRDGNEPSGPNGYTSFDKGLCLCMYKQ